MKKFKDPITPKEDSKKMKSPWNFDAPKYDERTSCYVNAGSHYGVGHRQPVGHIGNSFENAETLPMGRTKTIKVDEVLRGNLPLDIER